MKEFWTTIFESEPFELNLSTPLMESGVVSEASSYKSMDYDLVSAVKRQSTFFYQVSRPFMSHDLFLKEAIARYKGFLHLIKRNKEMSMKHFCIPTYDIDLIWHAHQLHSATYCRDTSAIYGEVLEHDDTDSDRSEAKKLSVEFMETTKAWEEVYGIRYWKAGALYRGSAPSPLTVDAQPLKDTCIGDIFANGSQNMIQLPKRMVMEVLLEIVGVEGIPQGHEEEFFIYISQKCQTNLRYTAKKKLSISSGSGKKQVVNLQSAPTAELLVELISSSSTTKRRNSAKIISSATISLNDVLHPEQELSVDRWFELFPPSETKETKLPISLHISLSFTPPISAPYVLHMAPSGGVVNKTSILDEAGNPVVALYMRCLDEKPREVIRVLESRKESTLARKVKNGWSLMESQWDFHPQYKPEIMYELLGETKVVFVPGKKLDFETKHNCKKDEQDNFITAVEFSTKNPYGIALALIDIKAGVLQIKEEWFLLPGTISAYCILYEVYGREWEKELEAPTPKEIEKSADARSFALYDIFNNDAYSAESGVSTGGGDDGGGSCSGGSCGGSCGGGCGG
ncbi:glycine-rich domain-containing protein 1-like [Beta vulgaris subsp. vulgaris]|uniref:glycine-rich domain-containing protein 1-like n=1 Tax=Beta vulgaris subsp. vulgaris TaxID=3555 RepID=UPI00203724D8|nr:glycine-rich domain-containing protein 1-like [Beta vulgaris subsp. vulgaris]